MFRMFRDRTEPNRFRTRGAENLPDHDLALLGAAVGEALLDDVTGEFVLRERHDLPRQRREHGLARCVVPVLKHVLHHVVPVLVARERAGGTQNLQSGEPHD